MNVFVQCSVDRHFKQSEQASKKKNRRDKNRIVATRTDKTYTYREREREHLNIDCYVIRYYSVINSSG